MPKGSQKSGCRSPVRYKGLDKQTDFTVYDFANVVEVKGGTGRMKKGAANAIVHEARSLTGKTNVGEELAWYEKDLSEFDMDGEEDRPSKEQFSDEDEEDQDNAESSCCSRTQSKSAMKESSCDMRQEGKTYPLDLWYMLARFIQPEDVAKFACICTATHSIVHTSVFWIHLYRRFCSDHSPLPSALGPQNIERTHGLKERVIRALFYSYPLFAERTKTMVPFENLSYHVEGLCCNLMWHCKTNNLQKYWNFYFKFTRGRRKGCGFLKKNKRKLDLINGMNDVDYNPEQDHCVLKITCANFISVPTVMGLVLSKIGLSVGHGMRWHKMKLAFQSQMLHVQNCRSAADAVTIMLDPVINAQVLYWWDHRYPRHS